MPATPTSPALPHTTFPPRPAFQTSGGDAFVAKFDLNATASVFQAGSGVGTYGGTTNLTATLLTATGSVGLPNETVAFSLNGTSLGTATTDANGVATLSGVSLASFQAGTYTNYLTASFAGDNNRSASNVSTDLVVNPAPLTITADNQSKVYAAALPTLTAHFTGFVNGDTAASLTTQPKLSTPATASSPVGRYAINASGAADPDYTITYVPGTLAVAYATSTSVAASVAPSTFSQSVTFTAAVLPTVATNTRETGTVSFVIDGGTAVPVKISNGKATLKLSTLGAGSHTVLASYSGDSTSSPALRA